VSAPTVVLYLRVSPDLQEQLKRLTVRALKLGRANPGRQKHSVQSEAVRLLVGAVAAELTATAAELAAPADQLDMFAAHLEAPVASKRPATTSDPTKSRANRIVKAKRAREALGTGALVSIQWSPTVTRVAKFVRFTKGGKNALVCIERVDPKGNPFKGKGRFGQERSIAARDVLGVAGT